MTDDLKLCGGMTQGQRPIARPNIFFFQNTRTVFQTYFHRQAWVNPFHGRFKTVSIGGGGQLFEEVINILTS